MKPNATAKAQPNATAKAQANATAKAQAKADRPWWRHGYVLYIVFVHVPITAAAYLSDDVLHYGMPRWLAFTLAGGLVVAMIPLIYLVDRWSREADIESAAMAKVPRPRRCDRCGETEPVVCPRPWLGTCPLRSIETGETYRDYLPAQGAASPHGEG